LGQRIVDVTREPGTFGDNRNTLLLLSDATGIQQSLQMP
jgi:hypothetical protein